MPLHWHKRVRDVKINDSQCILPLFSFLLLSFLLSPLLLLYRPSFSSSCSSILFFILLICCALWHGCRMFTAVSVRSERCWFESPVARFIRRRSTTSCGSALMCERPPEMLHHCGDESLVVNKPRLSPEVKSQSVFFFMCGKTQQVNIMFSPELNSIYPIMHHFF